MTIGIAQAGLDLGVAVGLGAVIGFERQWRQRLAGLRTNTLVALGAASFEVFENLFPSVGGLPRATRAAGHPPDPGAAGQPANRGMQPDPRTAGGIRNRIAASGCATSACVAGGSGGRR